MKRKSFKIIILRIIIAWSMLGCITPYKIHMKTFNIRVPGNMKKLSTVEIDSLKEKQLVGSFKHKLYNNFYVRDGVYTSILCGIPTDRNYKLDKQIEAFDYFMKTEGNKSSEVKYLGFSFVEKNKTKFAVSTNLAKSNDEKEYYRSFSSQDTVSGNIISGLVIYSQKDSIKGEQLLNYLMENIRVIPEK